MLDYIILNNHMNQIIVWILLLVTIESFIMEFRKLIYVNFVIVNSEHFFIIGLSHRCPTQKKKFNWNTWLLSL